MPKDGRRPTPAELGLDVTIGIVALSEAEGVFVAASDQMLSYADAFQASKGGLRKTLQFADDWRVNFAATDVARFAEIFKKLARGVKADDDAGVLDLDKVKDACEKSYRSAMREEFVKSNFVQFGYDSHAEFYKSGREDLGAERYNCLLDNMQFSNFGVELTVFGFNQEGRPRLFEVVNPGRVIEIGYKGYSVLGTGHDMAVASIQSKPLPMRASDLVYRVLEAKFATETASRVDDKTTLLIVNKHESRSMPAGDIKKIRAVWEAKLAEPTPADATAVIEGSGVLGI